MRTITTHHDGHGLNRRIKIEADPRSDFGGGTSNHYDLIVDHSHAPNSCLIEECMALQFQKGPRDHPNSTPGITNEVLLVVLIDRFEGFQEGPYACQENANVLAHLKSALFVCKERVNARSEQGVLGKNEPHA